MDRTAFVGIAEFAELLVVSAGAGALSLVGIYLELLALTELTTGDLVVGAWLLGMGLLALYAGVVMLGRDTAVPRFKRLLSGTPADRS